MLILFNELQRPTERKSGGFRVFGSEFLEDKLYKAIQRFHTYMFDLRVSEPCSGNIFWGIFYLSTISVVRSFPSPLFRHLQ